MNGQVLLLRQIWIANYYVKNPVKNSQLWKHRNWCFQKNSLFGILIHVLSWRQQKHWCFQRNDISKIVYFGISIHVLSWSVFVFITENFWQDFWRNNRQFIFDVVERLCYWINWSAKNSGSDSPAAYANQHQNCKCIIQLLKKIKIIPKKLLGSYR